MAHRLIHHTTTDGINSITVVRSPEDGSIGFQLARIEDGYTKQSFTTWLSREDAQGLASALTDATYSLADTLIRRDETRDRLRRGRL